MTKLQVTNILNNLITITLEQMPTNVIELEVAATESAFLEEEREQVRAVIWEHVEILSLYFNWVAQTTYGMMPKDVLRLHMLMRRSREYQLHDIQALRQFVETCDKELLCGDNGETILDAITNNETYLKLYLTYMQR